MEKENRTSKFYKNKKYVIFPSGLFLIFIIFQYLQIITMPLEKLKVEIGDNATKVLENRYDKKFELLSVTAKQTFLFPGKVRLSFKSPDDDIFIVGHCNTRFLENKLLEENYLSEKWDKQAAKYYQDKFKDIYTSTKDIEVSNFVGMNIGSSNQYFSQDELLKMKDEDFHYYWKKIKETGKFNISFTIKVALKDGATEQKFLEECFKIIQFIRTEKLQEVSYNFEIYDKTQIDDNSKVSFSSLDEKKYMSIKDSEFLYDERPQSAEDLKKHLVNVKY